MADLIIAAVVEGGTVGLAILALFAAFWERRRSAKREEMVLELAMASVKATTEQTAAIETNTQVMRSMERSLDRDRR